jgi:predicted nucleic acid-binding protein
MRFVDTNIFVRYLTDDHPSMSVSSARFLARVAAGAETAFVSESVIAEIAYVLHGQPYGLNNREIAERLRVLLATQGIQMPEKQTVRRAIDLYGAYAQLDFEDALAVAHMERLGIKEIVSFDRDFDRIPGITRVEP